MDLFTLPGHAFTDIVLVLPITRITKPWIDDSILQVDQRRLRTEVFFFRELEQCDESFSSS